MGMVHVRLASLVTGGNSHLLTTSALLSHNTASSSSLAVLPFLARQNLFLAPIGVVVALCALATLLQVNIARLVLGIFVA